MRTTPLPHKILAFVILALVVALITAVATGPVSNIIFDTREVYAQEQQKIAFMRDSQDFGKGAEIFIMNSDGSGQTRLTNYPCADLWPSLSADSSKIAFISMVDCVDESSAYRDMFVMNSDGSGQTRLTNSFDVDESDPSWSPDGTKIAFASAQHGSSTYNIYIMNADGSGQTRLTNTQGRSPDWSPDGTKIAFDSFDQIYIMNADGSGQTRLTNNDNFFKHDPSWSPDGSKIAFTRNPPFPTSSDYEIFVMNADGSGQTRLTNNNFFDGEPSWSPDGSKIAFTSDRHRVLPGHNQIYIMNADGSGQTRLTNNPYVDQKPAFGGVGVGDLSVTSVTAVQAPDDPDFVVDGKPALIKAKIMNTFTEQKSVDIHLIAQSVTTYDKTITVPIDPGEKDYYLPNDEFIIPSGSNFGANIVVDYDPNNQKGKIAESNENNNVGLLPDISIKTTKDVKILYVPLRVVGDTTNDPSCSDVIAVKDAAEKFIDATFPVNPQRVVHDVDCDFAALQLFPWTPPLDDEQRMKVFVALQELTWGRGYDHVVGVARNGFLNDVFDPNVRVPDDANGWSPAINSKKFMGIGSVVVEKDSLCGVLEAHEIGHTLGLEHQAIAAPGYWVTERIPTSSFANGLNTNDFIQGGIPLCPEGSTEVTYWISKSSFNNILGSLKAPGDPAVIGVSGIISKDGTANIVTLKRFDDVVDIPTDNPGAYTLEYRDSLGNSLAQTNFDVGFRYADPDLDSSVSGFALRIPDVQGTERIVLKKGDQVLAETSFDGGGGGDTTPPDTAISSAKDNAGNGIQNESSTTSDNIIFELSSPDADVSKFQCSLDGAAFEDNCSSPKSYLNLASGQQHTFRVIAVDAAGNEDPTPAVHVWTVQAKDTAAPETVIDSGKDGDGNPVSDGDTIQSDIIEFTFSSTDADVSKFQCSIDGAALEDNCTSPKSYSGLSDGAHTFSVIAVDGAGNSDQTPATFSWKIEAAKWTIKGFYPPVDMKDANGDPIVNTIKSGRSVPLKFEVFDEKGVELTSTGTDVITSFKTMSINCGTLADDSTDAIEITNTEGTSLRFDSSAGQYIQNWKTPSNSAGKCFKADLETADGTHTVAYFKMTR